MAEHRHHHDHDHDHSHDHPAMKNLTLAFFINLIFTLIEIVGGFLTNSVAVISDALHDLGDTISLAVSWYMERVAQKKRDHTFSFGYKRFSLLAALINGMVILFGSLFILMRAIPRLFHPEDVHVHGMFALALVGIAANGFAAFRLSRGKTMNESMITLHFIEDVAGWVIVLVVSIAMMFGNWLILDPLLSICLTCYLLWSGGKRLKKTLKIFLQSIPDDVDMKELDKQIRTIAHVLDVHDTHVWSLDGAYHVLSTHIVTASSLSVEDAMCVKNNIRKCISAFDIQHVTIELEHEGDACALMEC